MRRRSNPSITITIDVLTIYDTIRYAVDSVQLQINLTSLLKFFFFTFFYTYFIFNAHGLDQLLDMFCSISRANSFEMNFPQFPYK